MRYHYRTCALIVMSILVLISGNQRTVLANAATSQSWNFKDTNFNNLGEISSSKTVNGLNLIATNSKKMKIKSDSVNVSGTNYTFCLGLGGSGCKSYRSVKIPVSGKDIIKVILKSSGSEDRTLLVADANGKTLGALTAKTSASLATYTYSGKSGYAYLYSKNSNINIYKIQADSYVSSAVSTPTASTSPGAAGASYTRMTNYGKSKPITKTITVASGETYDGQGIKIIASGMGDGGQGEHQSPIFKLKSGATLKNVIIAGPGCDGVHCYGNNTVQNITWEDVGEDALTIKGNASANAGTINITNCTASYAYDKLFQVNAPCTINFTNINAYDIGKFVRQNGGTTFKCIWNITNCTINKVKDSIARTDSSSTLCYNKNLTVSDCKTWWKFPSSTQVLSLPFSLSAK